MDIQRRRVLAVLSLLSLALLPSVSRAADGVLIFAAASTANAIETAIKRFDRSTGIRVRASYASSGALAQQIDHGAPAHLYLSANPGWMRWAEGRGLIAPKTATKLFGNRLVLIAPADGTTTLAIRPGFPLLRALKGGRLAMADPEHVPAGAYARSALKKLGIWQSVETRTARTRDVRSTLALVERGEAPLGIVYRSDVLHSRDVRTVGLFPENMHSPIEYLLGIVAGGDRAAVRQFYSFLLSQKAAAIFAQFGFVTG